MDTRATRGDSQKGDSPVRPPRTPASTTPTQATPATTAPAPSPTPVATSGCLSEINTTTNLPICSASYLGGKGEDVGAAVEVAPDKTVVLAGTIAGNDFGKTPVNLKAGSSTTDGGNGVIIRTDSTGRTILSVTRLGASIDDMDINRTSGNIAVVGPFGVALLNNQANQVLWSKTPNNGAGGGATSSTGRRVAVGANGTVAALFNKQVTVLDANGNQLGQFTPTGTYVEDLAVDSAAASVIVTGYSQKDGGPCSQLQVAYVYSYCYAGAVMWKNYDWSHAEAAAASSSCADSRGYRVAIGRDNKLYFAGESAGGNSIYRFDPKNLKANAANIGFDHFNQAYNTASNHITYYAQLDNTTGNLVKGQWALARLSPAKGNKGNTINVRAITADEVGNVYIAGVSAAWFANRASQTIAGQPLGIYTGGDGYLIVAAADFKSRKMSMTWTGVNPTSGPKATINGVSVANGVAAIISTQTGNMFTKNPVQANNAGGSDAYYSVFPAVK